MPPTRNCTTARLSWSSRNRARNARSIRLAAGAGVPIAGIDGARIVVGAGVRLVAAEDPLRRGVQAVEIDVREDRVDRPDLAHELGRDHLGTRAVLCLGREHEPRIVREVGVALVIVMIDPRREAIAEPGRNGCVTDSNETLEPTVAANAMSSTTTRPVSRSALGSSRGEPNASCGRCTSLPYRHTADAHRA